MIVLSNAEHNDEYQEAIEACLKEMKISNGKKSHHEIKNKK